MVVRTSGVSMAMLGQGDDLDPDPGEAGGAAQAIEELLVGEHRERISPAGFVSERDLDRIEIRPDDARAGGGFLHLRDQVGEEGHPVAVSARIGALGIDDPREGE